MGRQYKTERITHEGLPKDLEQLVLLAFRRLFTCLGVAELHLRMNCHPEDLAENRLSSPQLCFCLILPGAMSGLAAD